MEIRTGTGNENNFDYHVIPVYIYYHTSSVKRNAGKSIPEKGRCSL